MKTGDQAARDAALSALNRWRKRVTTESHLSAESRAEADAALIAAAEQLEKLEGAK